MAPTLAVLGLFFFQDRLEATNVNVQYVQLKETKRIPGKRIQVIPKGPPLVFFTF